MGILRVFSPAPAPAPVIIDPVKDAFTRLVLQPDTSTCTGPMYATVGGVTVDLASAEYAAWYEATYGGAGDWD